MNHGMPYIRVLHKSRRWHFHGSGVNCDKLKFMELLLSQHKDLVKIKKVKDEECGIEMTYITIKNNE